MTALNQYFLHLLAISLTAMSMASCTMDDINSAPAATSTQLNFIEVSDPGSYSYFHVTLADGAVWLEGGGNRTVYYRSIWDGDSVNTTRAEIPLPSGTLYLTPWGEKVLLHSDGPQLDTGPAKVIEAGGEYNVSICQEMDMRCGEGAMRPTPHGLVMGAAAGPSFDNREFSLRWLGNDAREDIKVSDWPDAITNFPVGVASFGDIIMGAYYIESFASGTTRLIPFRFDISDPAHTYQEGAPFDHFNPVIIQGTNGSMGIADDEIYAIYTMGDPLYIHTFNWRDMSNHQIDSISKPLRFGTSFTSGLGTYQRSYRGVAEDNAYFIDPNGDERSLLMKCSTSTPFAVWQQQLAPVTFEASGESLGDASFVGGDFRAIGENAGLLYVMNSHHILSIDPAAMSVINAWSLARDIASTTFGMPSIWGANIFDGALHVVAIENINTPEAVILLSKVDL